jgi:hypothetical protein
VVVVLLLVHPHAHNSRCRHVGASRACGNVLAVGASNGGVLDRAVAPALLRVALRPGRHGVVPCHPADAHLIACRVVQVNEALL